MTTDSQMLVLRLQPAINGGVAGVGDDVEAGFPVLNIALTFRINETNDHQNGDGNDDNKGNGGENKLRRKTLPCLLLSRFGHFILSIIRI